MQLGYKRYKKYMKYYLKQTEKRNEKRVPISYVCSTNSQKTQPNTRTAQCARCLFMFLLAVLCNDQIIFQIK